MSGTVTIDPRYLEAATTRLCEESLEDFVEEAWPVVEPGVKYVPSWHIGAICEHLEACTRGEIRRLIINIPPRCMKSFLVCVFWPTWVWITKPHTAWLFSSYSHQLSMRDSLRCRDVIQSRWYQQRWGNRFRIRSDQNQKTKFVNDHSGFRMASSTAGVGTGEGGDFIIADDPHNVVEAESDAERKNVHHFWGQSMSTRGNDAKTAVHVVIMQRLHERDLTGYLLEEGGYEHLCLPMEYEPDRRCVTSIGWKDPRKREGELLCPDRFPPKEVAELKTRLGSYGSAGQLQQRPAPAGGAMFQRAWFDIVPVRQAGYLRRVRYWDLAAAVEGDFTVGCLMSRDADGFFYVEEILRGQWSPAERDHIIMQTAKMDGLEVEIVLEQEPGAAGKSVIDWLRRNLAGYAVWPDRPTGAKEVRAQPYAAQCEGRNVKLVAGPWNREYLDEMCIFPYGAHDDQVDSSSGAFMRISRYPTFVSLPEPQRPQENLFVRHNIPMATELGSWRRFAGRR